MITIAIDPGPEAGIAVFKNDQFLKAFSSAPPYTEMRAIIGQFRRAEVVCELGPTRGRQPETTNHPITIVVNNVPKERLFLVRPTQWKRHPQARSTDPTEGPHQADAARIGRWHIYMRRLRASSPG